MDSFSVGEVVEILETAYGRTPELTSYRGQEVVVIDMPWFGPHYGVRAGDGKELLVLPEYLRKKKPPSEYDGNQITKWADCPFKPKEMVIG